VLLSLGLALFGAPAQAAQIKPVPSLQPAATAKLWAKLTHRRHAYTTLTTSDCRPPARRLLHTNRLAAPGDQTRERRLALCPVLPLDPAALDGQKLPSAPTRPGGSARSARTSTPWRRSTSAAVRPGSRT